MFYEQNWLSAVVYRLRLPGQISAHFSVNLIVTGIDYDEVMLPPWALWRIIYSHRTPWCLFRFSAIAWWLSIKIKSRLNSYHHQARHQHRMPSSANSRQAAAWACIRPPAKCASPAFALISMVMPAWFLWGFNERHISASIRAARGGGSQLLSLFLDDDAGVSSVNEAARAILYKQPVLRLAFTISEALCAFIMMKAARCNAEDDQAKAEISYNYRRNLMPYCR